MGSSMNNMRVLLLSSALSIGSLVMGADSTSANTGSSKRSFVPLEIYFKSIAPENRILDGPIYVEEDINPLSKVKEWMVVVVKRNEYDISDGQFHIFKEDTSDLIAPDHSSTVVGLKKYKPYTLRLVVD
jgi:hypothetical protein